MKSDKQPGAWICWVMVFTITSSLWAQTTEKKAAPATKPAVSTPKLPPSQPPQKSFPKIGRVKGMNVYVRSGFNQNYYPVTKLNRGHKVTVVDEEFGWLKIIPPAGTHSLIEKTSVDRLGTDKNTGVVNRRS